MSRGAARPVREATPGPSGSGASACDARRGHGAAPGPRPTPGKTRLRRWPYDDRRGSGYHQALRGSCVHPGRPLVSAETAPRRFGSPATRFPNVPCMLRSGHAAGWPHRPGAAPWPRHAGGVADRRRRQAQRRATGARSRGGAMRPARCLPASSRASSGKCIGGVTDLRRRGFDTTDRTTRPHT